MSFYRIYRPQIIEEIDNLAVKEALTRLLSKPKAELPHAYLLSGPRGAGKTTAARVIAKLYNCTKLTKTGPCGACAQCRSIADGSNMDVMELDAASNRGIDEIRSIRDAIALLPSSGAFRIYIIDEVHMLTTEAFNALLKTLEEPPSHAVFVLATTDPHKVPVTIQSRCVSLLFAKAGTDELLGALSRIALKEKIEISSECLRIIAESVDGSFRDAVKYLEQASFYKGALTPDVVRTVLSLSDETLIDQFIQAFRTKNTADGLGIIKRLTEEGRDMRSFTAGVLRKLEVVLTASALGHSSDWTVPEVTGMIRVLSRAFSEIKTTALAFLPLELAVVEYCLEGESGDKKQEPQIQKDADKSEIKAQIQERVVEAETFDKASSLTVEKLVEHWPDIIAELKPHNHSIAGVMRSTRPKSTERGIVTIEAFYTFHRDKLSESKTKDILVSVFRKLFGEKVKVEVVLGKK